jgi:hypothetical protein
MVAPWSKDEQAGQGRAGMDRYEAEMRREGEMKRKVGKGVR